MKLFDVFRVLVVSTVLVICGCKPDQAVPPGPRPVMSVVVMARPVAGTTFPGTVQARVESNLAFRTLGRITARSVEAGDLVHKDEIVAQIDPLSLQLAVASAEADLRNAQATLENAQITERRKRGLADRNAGSVSDLEIAEQGLKSAEATVSRSQATLDKSREQLGYAQLRAEFDGVVTAVAAETGQTVTAGQSVLTVARLEQRDAVIDVSAATLATLRPGARFNVVLQLEDTIGVQGTLREIGPQADTTTRTHRLKISLDDAPDAFRLGSVVTATLIDAAAARSILVPPTAIQRRDDTDYVWIINRDSQTVSRKEVQIDTTASTDAAVYVLRGLTDGNEVVVAGLNDLSDGQPIKLVQEMQP
ncbi:MAG TPA: efflux RND transporter periplasmic adaptor subunit [Paenirhodobacter sp.]